ncbi:MAG: hypothetical protein EZS28_047511, partial [Streblomastix strix]
DHGQLIGICGDGANDCGALKTAHVEASITTPFTSKEATVEAVEAVLLKGRAALASSFHAFIITSVFSMIRFIFAQLLIYYDSVLSYFAYLIIEMIITLFILSIMRYSKTSKATVILENFYEDFVPHDMDNVDYDTHVQSFEMIPIFLASLISYNLAGGLNDFLMIIPTRSPSFFIFIALSIVVMILLLLGLKYFKDESNDQAFWQIKKIGGVDYSSIKGVNQKVLFHSINIVLPTTKQAKYVLKLVGTKDYVDKGRNLELMIEN